MHTPFSRLSEIDGDYSLSHMAYIHGQDYHNIEGQLFQRIVFAHNYQVYDELSLEGLVSRIDHSHDRTQIDRE
jgi:hypothetical protein